MALKTVVAALTEVPEALRGEYTQQPDGKFALALDGDPLGYAKAADLAATKAKVDEFRATNIGLMKQLDEIKPVLERVKDIDVDEYKALKAKHADLTKAGVKEPADLQKLLDAAVKPLKDSLEGLKQESAAKQAKLDQARLRDVIGQAVLKAGAQPGALDFLLQKAGDTFKVEEGEVKALPGKYSPRNGTDPLSVGDWVAAATTEFAFAFEKSSGGGTTGGGSSSKAKRQLINPTAVELGRNAEAILKGEVEVVAQQ